MKVSVKWSKRVYTDIELDPEAETSVFKQLLFSLTGVEPEQQRLMVKGAMVKDQPDWASFKKLRPGMTLVMMGSPMRAVFPERFSALQYLWETHSLQGRLTPLQASLLRLAISGMIHERLGEDCSHIAAQDCDVLVRVANMVVGSAKRVCAHPKAPIVFFCRWSNPYDNILSPDAMFRISLLLRPTLAITGWVWRTAAMGSTYGLA